ncbi:hypothetical protein BAZ12_18675 [Elizabethkingia miricola]|uniref:Uncharacterized protein n=1 Tax=Elizabethkingia miricola TaxID=172045 RepID=A0ABD4DJ61_ELIMR|nr:primase-helicase family protein [Elizabethkingia miricola]KUY17153.1 hypothetical protein ATB95_12295 [Elizabethkingia miricola]OPC72300.1 hypothetical protein BAZ13_06245 [Elizabethkingia miricola]OPC76041.1 hypothetical protein BAZ12_18675 [Elizabethkingia miricola]SPW31942.1 Uncharacterised protein [Elizabethkingia miricola]
MEQKEKIEIPFEVTDKGKVRFDTYDYIGYAEDLGFRRTKIFEVEHLIRIQDNIVRVVNKSDIIQAALEYLDKNFDQDSELEHGASKYEIKNAWINKARQISEDATLSFLKYEELKPLRDTQEVSYFFYQNIVVKVKAGTIETVKYQDLENHVFYEQIVQRGFSYDESCLNEFIPFRQFVHNVAGNVEERILAFEVMIGYMLHTFQNPALAKAVILLDSIVNEIGLIEGGTGKSLLVRGLSYMRYLCNISGKDFSSSSGFAFQRVTPFTSIVAINDIKENQNFEGFFGRITDGFTISRKYKHDIFIAFAYGPKMIITSNYYVKSPSGNSTERRKHEIELSTHYGKDLTVYDDFGHHFFDEWSEDQWLGFDHYMLYCIKLYLEKGLVKAPPINLELRKLISEVGLELMEFLDQILLTKTKLHKKELFAEFRKESVGSGRYQLSLRGFTIRLKKYLEYKNISYIETPSNTKVFIEILTEKDLTPIITIEDVKTDYRTVDTANKMTRLVNQLQKYFSTDNTAKN